MPSIYGAGPYGAGPYGVAPASTPAPPAGSPPPILAPPNNPTIIPGTAQPVPAGFTVYACNTATGQNLGPLDVTLQSWARVLNGSETATVILNADEYGLSAATRAYYRQLTEPALMSIVIDWAGTPVWAGPIWNRQRSGAQVTVNASGLSNLFTRRKLIDPTGGGYAGQTFTYSGVSLGTIATRLVQFTTGRVGGGLPIVYPGAGETDTDATHVRNWFGYELNTIGDLLTNLTGVDGGPDIDFVPQWTDGNRSAVRWSMITGTKTQPLITSGNQLSWDYSAPESGVIDLQVQDDASQLVTHQWAKGSGQDVSTLISGRADGTLLTAGYPLLEGETDYTTVTDQATLDTHTVGDLTAYRVPTSQWALTVDALTDPQLGSYQLGDIPTVRVAGDFWVPDGVYEMRIVGISGDGSTAVKLAVQGLDARGLDVLNAPDQSLAARIKRLERAAVTGGR